MPVSVKMQPIDRDLVIRLTGAPQDRSAVFAAFARDKLAEAEEQNRSVLGHVPPHKTFVDGNEGTSEDSVRPDGVIVYEFELVADAMAWIGEQLMAHSPVGSARDPHPGLYQASHRLYADGAEVPIGDDVPAAAEYVFINDLPYARKIEHGESLQFPDGVYQSIASLAQARFGNSVRVTFAYRAPLGGELIASRAGNKPDLRFPAIVVRLR